MPANKRIMQLALGLLSLESAPKTLEELHNSALFTGHSKQSLSLALQLLFEKKLIIRSSTKIGGRYYYFLSGKEQQISLAGSIEKFVLYSKENSSTGLRKRIVQVIEEENIALKLSDIAKRLNPQYTEVFLKKVQFHLRKLVEQGTLSRTGKPYQYYITEREHVVAVDTKKQSLPEQILSLLQSRKTALASSEIFDILNTHQTQAKPAALSLALKRLTQSGRLHKSSIRLGARSKVRGHLFAVNSEAIELRLKKMKEVKLKK